MKTKNIINKSLEQDIIFGIIILMGMVVDCFIKPNYLNSFSYLLDLFLLLGIGSYTIYRIFIRVKSGRNSESETEMSLSADESSDDDSPDETRITKTKGIIIISMTIFILMRVIQHVYERLL